MSEQKRATLLTISTQKGDVKKVKEKSKTIRFSLTLPESNEKSCPEYNYKDLLNSAEKKNKGKVKNHEHVNGLNPGLNHLDPFDDDDADVIRISKQFEEKYGGVPIKKRRGNKKDDYVDIGAGYDESDSFIDNTDAYDEMVPADITTVHGGFYINSGALEFKQVEYSGSEDSSDSNQSDKISGGTNRKRVIEDSDESESEDEKEDGKAEHLEKKPKIETNGVHKPVVKKKLILDDKQTEIKKRKVDENLLKKKAITVKDLLREKREELDVTVEIADASVKENKPSGSSSTINDAIESVINAVRGKNVDETSKESTSSSEAVAIVSAATTDSESSRDPLDQAQSEFIKQEFEFPIVKLPDDLPPHILEIINNIKKAAESSSEGKVKFFSTPVNNMLLSLEINSRKLLKITRITIYEHLAPFVKCKRDTLMRRAKKLYLDLERKKFTDAMQRLRAIVDTSMPIVKKSYERECQKVRDEMFLASANANANVNTNTDNGDINCKVKRTPRKKFPWSEEARKVFQDCIVSKKKCYPLEGHHKEPFEVHLEQFLKTEVLPMWPEGWMSIAALNKQTKLITENNVKQKMLKKAKTLKPISLDVSATFTPVIPVRKSPVCPGASGITVTPIPSSAPILPASVSVSVSSPKSSNNGPKLKQQQLQLQLQQHSPSDLSVTSVNKKVSATEISAVNPKETNSLVAPSTHSSVTITNVEVRTNCSTTPSSSSSTTTPATTTTTPATTTTAKKDVKNDDITVSLKPKTNSVAESKSVISNLKTIDLVAKAPETSKPTNLKQRILENLNKQVPSDSNDDCQIIDLTESPVTLNRKPGPKSKTRNPDGSVKLKQRPVEKKEGISVRKTEELTGSQALNQLIITGLTKYGTTADQQSFPKETPNEDDMEQVMKDLKELQQMQEHARQDLDVMSPSSSPVSVIAYNSSYSPSKIQADDLSKTRRPSTDTAAGFQDIFQKHLYQEAPLFSKTSPATGVVYNSQQKSNSYNNSVNNFPGTVSNSINNIRYTQSSSKYPTSLTHLTANTAGATNHTDDFALFQNFLYQYGFHNSTGSKQKSPP